MLRGQENLLVAGKSLFKRTDAGFASDDERRHLLREDNHVAHRIMGTRFISCFSRLNIRPLIQFPRPRQAAAKWKGSASLFQQISINFASADHVRAYEQVAYLRCMGK